jgi:hypothetical protein
MAFSALFHADGDQQANTCLDTNCAASVCKIGMIRHLVVSLTTNSPDDKEQATKNWLYRIAFLMIRSLIQMFSVCGARNRKKSVACYSIQGLYTVLIIQPRQRLTMYMV